MYAPRKNLEFLQHVFRCEFQPCKNLKKTHRRKLWTENAEDCAGNAAWYASRSNGATAVGVSQRLICIVFSRALNMEKYGYEERKHSVSGNLG